MNIKNTLFAASLALLSGQASAIYIPVDFSSQFNMSRSAAFLSNGGTLPAGAQNFGGVPFSMGGAADINDPWGWNAYFDAVANGGDFGQTVSLTIPVNQYGVTDVYTLISTYWGQGGITPYVTVTFNATNGVTSSVALLGNSDIRDYNQNFWTNFVNGTTTVEVFNNGFGQRVDMQHFALPSSFASETLLNITITDTGAASFQRVFMTGVTVQIPGVGTLAAFGLAGLGGLRRRR